MTEGLSAAVAAGDAVRGTTSPNPPVGCALVGPAGDLIATGATSPAGGPHAEVNALLFATRDTKGATAYITDPPCPGCRKALAAAGIVRAVWPGGSHDRRGLTNWG